MAVPFFISPLFMDFILPFVLVFTLIFAILQRTKVLGDDAQRINLIMGIVIGLMLIAFPHPRSIIVLLMPYLAVVSVILLVYLMLMGFATGKKDENILGEKEKIAVVGLIGISLAIYLLMITGYWDFIMGNVFTGGPLIATVLMIAAIVGVIVAVILGETK